MRTSYADFTDKATGPVKQVDGRFLSLLFGLILCISLISIQTRFHGLLATFWLSDAVLLGVLLKYPSRAQQARVWLVAGLAYICAELIAQQSLGVALIFWGLQTLSIGLALYLLNKKVKNKLNLRRPHSLWQLFISVLLVSIVGAVPSAYLNQYLYGESFFYNWTYWVVAEQLAYIAILPVILAAPRFSLHALKQLRFKIKTQTFVQLAPLALLCSSTLLGITIGGAGAIAFPVLPLLWCALRYSLFSTYLLTLLFVVWTFSVAHLELIPLEITPFTQLDSISLRLAIISMALAPIITASIMASRNEALQKLRYLAQHDPLTGLLNQQTFYQQAQQQLDEHLQTQSHVCLLILDLDYFKQVNDNYGHAAGDHVIQTLSGKLQHELRDKDIAGRLGGEEFGILLADCAPTQAFNVAERIRASVLNTHIAVQNENTLNLTVSIGITYTNHDNNLKRLLHQADRALYRAKRNGRNRSHIYNSAADKAVLN